MSDEIADLAVTPQFDISVKATGIDRSRMQEVIRDAEVMVREGPPKVMPWRLTECEFRRLWRLLNPDLADPDLPPMPATLYGRPVEIVDEEWWEEAHQPI